MMMWGKDVVMMSAFSLRIFERYDNDIPLDLPKKEDLHLVTREMLTRLLSARKPRNSQAYSRLSNLKRWLYIEVLPRLS